MAEMATLAALIISVKYKYNCLVTDLSILLRLWHTSLCQVLPLGVLNSKVSLALQLLVFGCLQDCLIFVYYLCYRIETRLCFTVGGNEKTRFYWCLREIL